MTATFAGICPHKVEHEPHLVAVTLRWQCNGHLLIACGEEKMSECGSFREHRSHTVDSAMDLPCKGSKL